MSEAVLVFPHQLFQQHPAMLKSRPVYLLEEWLYFRQYNFHQQKLILHRSSMKFYEEYLKEQNYTVHYIDTTDERNDVRKLISFLSEQKITHLYIADVVDKWLINRVQTACRINNIELTVYASPSFLNTMDEVEEYFSKKKTYFHSEFYIQQRKKRKILLEADGKPIGGKWTFDADNRMKFPKKEIAPAIHFPPVSNYINEAIEYVQQHFPNNYGNIDAPHYFVATFKESADWLNDFLENRFEKFGIYEDAMVAEENILHHSVLTPMLNIGLLIPQQIIDATFKHAENHNIPLNSL
jgi:deoxyribodipyrimidine photolyase-related protein